MAKTTGNQGGNTQANGGGSPEAPVTLSKDHIRLLQENQEQQKKIKELEKMMEKAASQPVPTTSSEADLQALKQQVALLSSMVANSQSQAAQIALGQRKQLYKPIPPDDYQDEAVTFTARWVFHVVVSYLDHRGMEVIAPYKPITFIYAASDIRKDGREEEIINFSQYTTHLKAEIEFLRNNPVYGLHYTENMNSASKIDIKRVEYRARAANEIMNSSPEGVMDLAKEYDIPNRLQKSVAELKLILVQLRSEQYEREASEIEHQRRSRLILTEDKKEE